MSTKINFIFHNEGTNGILLTEVHKLDEATNEGRNLLRTVVHSARLVHENDGIQFVISKVHNTVWLAGCCEPYHLDTHVLKSYCTYSQEDFTIEHLSQSYYGDPHLVAYHNGLKDLYGIFTKIRRQEHLDKFKKYREETNGIQ